MITQDFHGWTVEEALAEVHRVVGDVRMEETACTAEFITGHGVIQNAIMDELVLMGLSPSIQLSNSGVVTVVIE